MPRTARIVLPDCPHHVVQRGHNRQAVFTEAEDYRYYLENLAEWKNRLGCKVYGYCLMTNHVHLIVDPGKDPASLGLLMKRVAARQTRLVNRLEGRTGSLWEGRYKSSAVETDTYLMACSRYVERNPVRAGMTADAGAYRWSSYRAKVGQEPVRWLDLDPCYRSLGDTVGVRQQRYRDWVRAGSGESELRLLREALQRGHLTGTDRFVRQVSEKLGQRLEQRGPGRPRKRQK